jgi:integrase
VFHCLDQIGARRAEIINIKVKDIQNAIASDSEFPSIRLINLKQRQKDRMTRYVPVSRVFLSEISNFIRSTRRIIINNTIGKSKDHGYLIISTTTGNQLSEDTLTTFFNNWRSKIGIKEELHPHLFRHTYITNKLVDIIASRDDIKTAEDFKKIILNAEWFKLQLKEWTGHATISSMDTYIKLAFARHINFNVELKSIQVRSALDSTRKAITRMKSNIKSGKLSIEQTFNDIELLLSNLEADIC